MGRRPCAIAVAPPPTPPHTYPSRPIPRAWNASTVDVNIFALFTNGTCAITACWVRHMRQKIWEQRQHRNFIRYSINVGFHSINVGGGATSGQFQTPEWRKASKARIDLLYTALHKHARVDERRNRLYILSDLDVLPLRSYTALVDHFIQSERAAASSGGQQPDILFMREPPGSCGMTPWLLNTGFMVMRNSQRTRALWRWVGALSRGKMYDQDVANFILLKKVRANEVTWGVLPSDMVTAAPEDVAQQTVAFHAVGVTGPAKFERLRSAWERHRDTSAHSSSSDHGFSSFGCSANVSRVDVPRAWRYSSRTPREMLCLARA